MSIFFKNPKESIWDTEAETIVIPVNCHGVCGAGLAKEFEGRFPKAAATYKKLCERRLKPGTFSLIKNHDTPSGVWGIGLFTTKDDWREPSQMEWIQSGMLEMCLEVIRRNLHTIAIPALGCGLGGLEWCNVAGVISQYMGPLICNAYLYGPREKKPDPKAEVSAN